MEDARVRVRDNMSPRECFNRYVACSALELLDPHWRPRTPESAADRAVSEAFAAFSQPLGQAMSKLVTSRRLGTDQGEAQTYTKLFQLIKDIRAFNDRLKRMEVVPQDEAKVADKKDLVCDVSGQGKSKESGRFYVVIFHLKPVPASSSTHGTNALRYMLCEQWKRVVASFFNVFALKVVVQDKFSGFLRAPPHQLKDLTGLAPIKQRELVRLFMKQHAASVDEMAEATCVGIKNLLSFVGPVASATLTKEPKGPIVRLVESFSSGSAAALNGKH
jgi:hypothetical protein